MRARALLQLIRLLQLHVYGGWEGGHIRLLQLHVYGGWAGDSARWRGVGEHAQGKAAEEGAI